MSQSQPLVIYSAHQVQQAVQKMAGQIAAWWKSFSPQPLHLVCVLEGARPLAKDLSRRLLEMNPGTVLQEHFIQVRGTQGQALLNTRQLLGGSEEPGAWDLGPILVLDDLLDSGKTLSLVKDHFRSQTQAPLKTAVLIRKCARSEIPVDFWGLDLGLRQEALQVKGLKDYWLYGYGMDLNGEHRDLDYVAWVEVK
jgi:hypoxanthine phosphoribosyltransferase